MDNLIKQTTPIGILLMSYGSIYTMDDIERFYTHILKGKKPPQEYIDELRERFLAIGGKSPLNEITYNQAKKLQNLLNNSMDNSTDNSKNNLSYKVFVAFKHINPYIEDVVKQMENENISKAIAIIMSPYYSNYNISDYFKRTKSDKINFKHIYGYYDNPLLIDIFYKRIQALREKIIKIHGNSKIFYIFSAHSLPEKILPDPYPTQLQFVVNKLVERLGITDYVFCYQSQGKTKDKWLGPDILDQISKIPDEFKIIISCPIGFICEHLEVLYDIDIEAKNYANQLGKELYRITLPNDDDDFILLLKNVIQNSFI